MDKGIFIIIIVLLYQNISMNTFLLSIKDISFIDKRNA